MAQLDPSRFARISAELLAEREELGTMQRIVDGATSTVPGCDYASISLMVSKGRVETPVSTSQIAVKADALQYDLSEGPCLQAVWDDNDMWLVQDTQSEQRWPNWAPSAFAVGVRSVLSVKLAFLDDTVGGLNLYAGSPYAYDSDSVDVAHVYAAHAAAALAAARELTTLRTALQTRHMIGMAQGVLMERFGLDEQRAFHVLRRYSQETNTKLRDIAEQVLASGRLPVN